MTCAVGRLIGKDVGILTAVSTDHHASIERGRRIPLESEYLKAAPLLSPAEHWFLYERELPA
jgi:hypothetical protein